MRNVLPTAMALALSIFTARAGSVRGWLNWRGPNQNGFSAEKNLPDKIATKDALWTADFPGSITVCDLEGIVVEMNEKAAQMYRADGGKALIGKNLFDCHPEPSRTKLQQLLASGESNIYTTEKKGIKKFIYQTPWFQDGQRRGMIELVLEIPFNMPHFIRD